MGVLRYRRTWSRANRRRALLDERFCGLVMGAQECRWLAENFRHVHPLLHGAKRNLAGRERGAELDVGLQFATMFVADVEDVAPQTGVFVVKLVERQLRRQDGVDDVEHLPVLRGKIFFGGGPEIGAWKRSEDRESTVERAHLLDPIAEPREIFRTPRRIDNEVRRESNAELFQNLDRFDVV